MASSTQEDFLPRTWDGGAGDGEESCRAWFPPKNLELDPLHASFMLIGCTMHDEERSQANDSGMGLRARTSYAMIEPNGIRQINRPTRRNCHRNSGDGIQ
jgi:hypothetical protein